MKNIKWGKLIINLAIPLIIGGLSALITKNSMDIYTKLELPTLAPPSIAFPIVWTILFLLMGISAYLISVSDSPSKNKALLIYGIQLAINFIWPILFFNMGAYLIAFIWLLLLIILVGFMIYSFAKINKTAGALQIPYLLWLLFAAYLNFSIYLLN